MIKKLGNKNVKSIQNLADKTIIEYDDKTDIYWHKIITNTSKDSKSAAVEYSEIIIKKPKMIFY